MFKIFATPLLLTVLMIVLVWVTLGAIFGPDQERCERAGYSHDACFQMLNR
ncbi:hypothetical protein EVB71_077 [Rhizobium phage RHph_Y55]|nr:hypothetical protein EVB71_077 [Rhizobium phage RHph_Y55]